MTEVQELGKAIGSLPEADYSRFRQWFLKRDGERYRFVCGDLATGRVYVSTWNE